MSSIGQRIIYYRQSISPRTSYATAGKATDEIIFQFSDTDCNIDQKLMGCADSISSILKSSKEFEIITKCYNYNIESFNIVNGHVVVSYNPSEEVIPRLMDLIIHNKTILVFALFIKDGNEAELMSKFQFLANEYCLVDIENFDTCVLYILHKNTKLTKTKQDMIGNWGHPTVSSQAQFKYLWDCTDPSSTEGKRRVLQRLANHTIKRNNQEYKLKSEHFEAIIQKALAHRINDYEIYSILRSIYLGLSLTNAADVSKFTILADKDLIPNKPWGDEEGDGRSNFMVKKLKDCIEEPYLSRIKTVLDYGCAEGKITASLCKELKVSPSKCFGADVRKIPSDGFTFILLPSETNTPLPIGSILPDIQSGSIDLVTASMVFHHVRHVKAALCELRRVISDQGLLVIREHDCCSSGEAVFLDITHGLYSLALSEPIEWPAFTDEYNAWYRSREQWNELMTLCGFVRVERQSGTIIARQYNASVQNLSTIPLTKNIPNVIKAYYAVYVPLVNSNTHQPRPENTPQGNNKRQKLAESNDVNIKIDTTITNTTSANTTTVVTNTKGKTDNDIWVLYESSKHRGSFYVIDPKTNQTHWITGGIKSPLSSSNMSSSSSSQEQQPCIGEFLNPITKAVSQIRRVEYASKT